MDALARRQFAGNKLQHVLFCIRKANRIFLFVFLQECVIATDVLVVKDSQRIDGISAVKVHQRRDPSQPCLQILIARLNQLDVVEPRIVNRFIDPLLRDLIEIDRRTAGNHPRSFADIPAHIVFVVSFVAGERDGNQEALFIIADKIKDHNIVFVFKFSKASAKLLNKDYCGLSWT